MTDNQTPPDWVLIEAVKRCGWPDDPKELRGIYQYLTPSFQALCDMIQKHEQPPVDRKLLCAREAVRQTDWGNIDSRETACLRAIELFEEGFGK